MWSTAIRGASSRTLTMLLRKEAGTAREYISRAHPATIPEFPVPVALDMVLQEIESRKVKRSKKWERNTAARQSKGLKVRKSQELIDSARN